MPRPYFLQANRVSVTRLLSLAIVLCLMLGAAGTLTVILTQNAISAALSLWSDGLLATLHLWFEHLHNIPGQERLELHTATQAMWFSLILWRYHWGDKIVFGKLDVLLGSWTLLGLLAEALHHAPLIHYAATDGQPGTLFCFALLCGLVQFNIWSCAVNLHQEKPSLDAPFCLAILVIIASYPVAICTPPIIWVTYVVMSLIGIPGAAVVQQIYRNTTKI